MADTEAVERGPLERLAEHLSARPMLVGGGSEETQAALVDWLDYSLNRCGLVIVPEQSLTRTPPIDVEAVARAFVAPLGYAADVDWERTWVGNQCDSIETGSLAYLCRELARAAIAAMRANEGN